MSGRAKPGLTSRGMTVERAITSSNPRPRTLHAAGLLPSAVPVRLVDPFTGASRDLDLHFERRGCNE